MENNRLLIIALILISPGLIGIFASASLGYQWPGGISPIMNMMMNGGMMGQCMMNRDQMRDMMQRMMPGMLPPSIKSENLPDPNSRGAKLLDRYCSQCHNLPSPAMHSAVEWPLITRRMFARMTMMAGMMGIENPTSDEQREIVAYMKAHSLKPVSPSLLPAPESKSAILFKETCSQCHALPDPTLHTAQEWTAVVERMRGNMQAMDRRVITDQEKADIVAYLNEHARK